MASKSWIEVPIDQEIVSVPEDGYAPFFFPPEGADLLFHFTEESFLRVLSALINGAALTYPDTWLQVVWDFLQNVEYPVSLCDKIAECIASNEDTQAVIRAFVTNDESIRDWAEEIAGIAVLTAEQLGSNMLKPGACDPGYTFNQSSKLVFMLNQLSEDLFEAMEVGTNALERASLFIQAIPAIGGLLPFDEALTLADNLVENVAEDYTGNYDQGLYDDLRCGLWCTFKDDCELNIDEALAFYEDKLGTSLPQNPAETLQAIAQFILIGDIPGDFTVYAMHTLIIAAMRSGQEMFGINFAQLGLRITAAGDESDNDWETLCTDCVDEWEKVWDFHDSDVGWTLVTGVYQATVGFHQAGSGANPYTVDLKRDVDWGDARLTHVDIDVASEHADPGSARGVYYPDSAEPPQFGYDTSEGIYTMSFDIADLQPDTIAVHVSNDTTPGYNYMFRVVFRGTGIEPTW